MRLSTIEKTKTFETKRITSSEKNFSNSSSGGMDATALDSLKDEISQRQMHCLKKTTIFKLKVFAEQHF